MIRFRSTILIAGWLFSSSSAFSQLKFTTVVPQRPVVLGESFQVQYVLENADDISGFSAPQFQGFRVVSGPNVYLGNKFVFHKNIVITLAPIREGKFKIPGAKCSINGITVRSDDAYVKVVPLNPADESPYFLAPGEDPFRKIRENMFLKLIVDKQTCFIGEPLVATFKLYSRLQSKSDVIKNPGFYGFSVYDMISVDDKVKAEESLRGHWFDVHTIRKVQLYPLQAGMFTIDPMELANKIEFSRSSIDKKTEQEVSEHMYNKDAETKPPKAEVYEVNLKTDAVAIKVKPLPLKNVGDTFTGAVGDFSIKAFIEKDSILRNQENSLTVQIIGRGNFQILSAPAIKWPKGVDAFESSVSDALEKQKVPLTGQRRFKYVFLSTQPGKYLIPPVSFSFFNLKTRSYKTISTQPLAFLVTSKLRKEQKSIGEPHERSYRATTWWLIGLIILILLTLFGWLTLKRRNEKIKLAEEEKLMTKSRIVSIEEALKPAELAINESHNAFYWTLNHSIWNYLGQHLNLSGSHVNKIALSNILIAKGINSQTIDDLTGLIHDCEKATYTSAGAGVDKAQQFEKAKRILKVVSERIT